MPSVRSAQSLVKFSQLFKLILASLLALCIWSTFVPLALDGDSQNDNHVNAAVFEGFVPVDKEFVLYRAIGNDLPPRHAPGQSLNNIKFILENEASLPGLTKEWIINRIVNNTERQNIKDLLNFHKQVFHELEINYREYDKIETDWTSKDFNWQDITRYTPMENHPVFPDRALWRASAIDHVLAKKNRYIINNNGARNKMLELGISRGYKWILPFDGNCFLTPSAWVDMANTIRANENKKYFYVPMERMRDNAQLFDPEFKPTAREEPQLIFRRDARERFDEKLTRYGRRPKVDMLFRLGIPGLWDAQLTKSKPYYENYSFTLSYDIEGRDTVPRASWVARLFSGSAAQEVTTTNSASLRKYNRCLGVNRILNWANTICAEKLYAYAPTVLLAFDYHTLAGEKVSYEQKDKPISSIVDVMKIQALQYLNEKPGFWRTAINSNSDPITIPFEEYETSSENAATHKSRLSQFFHSVTALTLAGYFTEDTKFSLAAVGILEQFFLNDATQVTPETLVYAMYGDEKNVKRLHEHEAFVLGSIEFKDWYYVLDMVRLLKSFIDDRLYNAVQLWMKEYMGLVRDIAETEYIPVPGFEYACKGARGVWYDVQMASIAAFIGDSSLLFDFVEKTKPRLLRQYATRNSPRTGEYPGVAMVTNPSWKEDNTVAVNSYSDSLYILHGYIMMATFAEKMGIRLWTYGRKDDQIMKRAFFLHLTGQIPMDAQLSQKESKRLVQDALNGFSLDMETSSVATMGLAHIARMQYPELELTNSNMAMEGKPPARNIYEESSNLRLYIPLKDIKPMDESSDNV
eukprot:CFRG5590T1